MTKLDDPDESTPNAESSDSVTTLRDLHDRILAHQRAIDEHIKRKRASEDLPKHGSHQSEPDH